MHLIFITTGKDHRQNCEYICYHDLLLIPYNIVWVGHYCMTENCNLHFSDKCRHFKCWNDSCMKLVFLWRDVIYSRYMSFSGLQTGFNKMVPPITPVIPYFSFFMISVRVGEGVNSPNCFMIFEGGGARVLFERSLHSRSENVSWYWNWKKFYRNTNHWIYRILCVQSVWALRTSLGALFKTLIF